MAPPCGTASQARKAGDGGPPPLRSSRWPDGLPGLSQVDEFRVQQANLTYQLVADVVRWCLKHQRIFAVENPLNSLFWQTSFWQSVSQSVHYVSFDHCAYGGQRQKQTAIAHNCAAFASLARFCPGPERAKQHLPWGRDPAAPNGFATSQETAYPSQLAAGIALAFIKGMVSRGWDGARVALSIDQDKLATAAERAIAGIQSKASRFPAPVSEHKMVVVLRSQQPLACPCAPGKRLDQPLPLPAGVRATPFVACVPAKSQLLRSTPISVKVGDWLAGSKVEAEQLAFEQAWGVLHSEAEFVKAAVKAGHPSSFREALPDVLQKAVKLNETMDDADLAKMRTHWILKWAKRAEQLASEEAELKKALHPSCRAILEPKRLLVALQGNPHGV